VPPDWPWSTPPAKRGRGPRAYRRSDQRIAEDINDRLLAQNHIDASDVHVTVQDGGVELTGSVESRDDKRFVEAIADSVAGTHDVANRLVIHEHAR
jgi:osmotically-inducible protein OsmY